MRRLPVVYSVILLYGAMGVYVVTLCSGSHYYNFLSIPFDIFIESTYPN